MHQGPGADSIHPDLPAGHSDCLQSPIRDIGVAMGSRNRAGAEVRSAPTTSSVLPAAGRPVTAASALAPHWPFPPQLGYSSDLAPTALKGRQMRLELHEATSAMGAPACQRPSTTPPEDVREHEQEQPDLPVIGPHLRLVHVGEVVLSKQ